MSELPILSDRWPKVSSLFVLGIALIPLAARPSASDDSRGPIKLELILERSQSSEAVVAAQVASSEQGRYRSANPLRRVQVSVAHQWDSPEPKRNPEGTTEWSLSLSPMALGEFRATRRMQELDVQFGELAALEASSQDLLSRYLTLSRLIFLEQRIELIEQVRQANLSSSRIASRLLQEGAEEIRSYYKAKRQLEMSEVQLGLLQSERRMLLRSLGVSSDVGIDWRSKPLVSLRQLRERLERLRSSERTSITAQRIMLDLAREEATAEVNRQKASAWIDSFEISAEPKSDGQVTYKAGVKINLPFLSARSASEINKEVDLIRRRGKAQTQVAELNRGFSASFESILEHLKSAELAQTEMLKMADANRKHLARMVRQNPTLALELHLIQIDLEGEILELEATSRSNALKFLHEAGLLTADSSRNWFRPLAGAVQ